MQSFPMQMSGNGGGGGDSAGYEVSGGGGGNGQQMWNSAYSGIQYSGMYGMGNANSDGDSRIPNQGYSPGLMDGGGGAPPSWWGLSPGHDGAPRTPSPSDGGFRGPPPPWMRGPRGPRPGPRSRGGKSTPKTPPLSMTPPDGAGMPPVGAFPTFPNDLDSKRGGNIRPRSFVDSVPGLAPPPISAGDLPPLGPTGPPGKGAKGSANANKKRYVCEICQKRFSTAWYVRVHRKSHNGERPYICHNCGKGFMLPNVLQVHLRKCEKNNPPAPAKSSTPTNGSANSHPPAPPPSGLGLPSMEEQLHQSPPQTSPSMGIPQQQLPFPESMMAQQAPFGGPGIPSMMASPGYANQRFPLYSSPYGPPDMSVPFNPDSMNAGNFDMQHQGPPIPPPMNSPGPPTPQQQYPPPVSTPNQQQPLPPPPSIQPGLYSPNMTGAGGGGTGPSSVQSSSEATPPPPPPSSSSGHFLANDRLSDQGGGCDGLMNTLEDLPHPDLKPGVGGQSELYCASCDVQFDEKSTLSDHVKSHKPYACEVCEKRFSQKCNLITHMRLHTGEKPYQCSYCDKRFTQKGNLDAHLKTHTKEKPYPCPHCDKKFSFKSTMTSHVKQSHAGLLSHLNTPPGLLGDFDEVVDDIGSIKQQLKFAAVNAAAAVQPHSPSRFIPTPQSSLDSLNNAGPENGISSSSSSASSSSSTTSTTSFMAPPMNPTLMSTAAGANVLINEDSEESKLTSSVAGGGAAAAPPELAISWKET